MNKVVWFICGGLAGYFIKATSLDEIFVHELKKLQRNEVPKKEPDEEKK